MSRAPVVPSRSGRAPAPAREANMAALTRTYRAEQVGSLLRPVELLQARSAYVGKRIDVDELRRVEDKAILESLTMQKEIGLDVYTDGEYRRGGWQTDMA